MSLLKIRMWPVVVAALVVAQAPVMLAVKDTSSPRKRARVDRQIEEVEQSPATGTVRVIVRADGTRDWASLVKALRNKGIKVGRQARRANAISLDLSRGDLEWLETLPGIDS